MKRSVKPEYEFNKEKFIEVMKKAIGNMSYSAFAKKADVSFGYISKYMNGKPEVAPTLVTIKKIASATELVDLAELLEAAGYDSSKYADDDYDDSGGSIGIPPMNLLMNVLCNANFKWKYINPIGYGGPISIQVEEAPFDMWYFIPVNKVNISKADITSVLATKEAEDISSNSKVSFITTNRRVYEDLLSMEFNILLVRMSAIYINPSGLEGVKESYMNTAIDVSLTENKYVVTNKQIGVTAPLSI